MRSRIVPLPLLFLVFLGLSGTAPAVAGSLLSFVVVYFAVFGAGIYYILRTMATSPDSVEPDIDATQPYRASHPLAPVTHAREDL